MNYPPLTLKRGLGLNYSLIRVLRKPKHLTFSTKRESKIRFLETQFPTLSQGVPKVPKPADRTCIVYFRCTLDLIQYSYNRVKRFTQTSWREGPTIYKSLISENMYSNWAQDSIVYKHYCRQTRFVQYIAISLSRD